MDEAVLNQLLGFQTVRTAPAIASRAPKTELLSRVCVVPGEARSLSQRKQVEKRSLLLRTFRLLRLCRRRRRILREAESSLVWRTDGRTSPAGSAARVDRYVLAIRKTHDVRRDQNQELRVALLHVRIAREDVAQDRHLSKTGEAVQRV